MKNRFTFSDSPYSEREYSIFKPKPQSIRLGTSVHERNAAKPHNPSNEGLHMTIHNSLAELIGNTPLVKLNHIPQAAGVKATIAVKVEYFNPGGSSKDRIAERIIDAAEQSGQLKPGGVIVEPTSGNTGVGLALVAQQRGYRTIFTLPDKVSESKRAVLRAYGAEVIVTPTDAGPDDPRSYYQVAERLANTIPGASARTSTTTRTAR